MGPKMADETKMTEEIPEVTIYEYENGACGCDADAPQSSD